MGNPLKICLVSSGGGHLRQILAMKSLYRNHPHYFVAERTPLSESLRSVKERCYFVPDTALGKLTTGPSAWWHLSRNFRKSLWILLKEKPDLVVSTGAGCASATLFWARVLGVKVVYVETVAHSKTLSRTGRFAHRWSHLFIVQWSTLQAQAPGAVVVETVKTTGKSIPPKKDAPIGTLVTVGTHAPFDRLLREVEKIRTTGKLPQPVMAQVGIGGYRPSGMDCFETCSSEEMKNLLDRTDCVVTHAGTGSILAALEGGCRVIAVPRRKEQGEHYDDHQEEFLTELESWGAVLGVRDPKNLGSALDRLKSFRPKEIRFSPEPVVAEIRQRFPDLFAGAASNTSEKG